MSAWIPLLTVVLGMSGLGACGPDAAEVGGQRQTAQPGADPLDLPAPSAPAGSLDDLHDRVLVKRCAGEPGLCHAGQFEPDLSTPALAYANLVYRPSLEKEAERRYRVAPGAPAESVLIMKLRGAGVATRMPLGAAPLPEADIAAFEAWIAGGALRRPGARPAPRLNNPPRPPEIGLYNERGERLGQGGPAPVSPGDVLVLRHSVQDFETAEADIPVGLFTLITDDGRNVLLAEGTPAPQIGYSRHDPAGTPAGTRLSWVFRFPIPTTVKLMDPAGTVTPAPASGLRLSVLALYLDSLPVDEGISAFRFAQGLVQVR